MFFPIFLSVLFFRLCRFSCTVLNTVLRDRHEMNNALIGSFKKICFTFSGSILRVSNETLNLGILNKKRPPFYKRGRRKGLSLSSQKI